MRTVYADVIFAENFASDWLVLYFCKKMLELNVRPVRLAVSACVGGLYAVLHALFAFDGALSVALTLVTSALICAVCFGVTPRKTYIKSIALFYAVSFLLGGAVTTARTLLVRLSDKTGLFSDGLPLWVFFAVCSVASLLFSTLSRMFHPTSKNKNVKLEIEILGKTHTYELLCDTGNLLRDPYSDLPVIILKGEKYGEITGYSDPSSLSEKDNIKLHLRYVPVKTANNITVMLAVKPQKIRYRVNNKNVELNAVVAFDANKGNNYAGTSGLLPYCLVQNIE